MRTHSSPNPAPLQTDVLIAGGGPCGLTLAIELGRRGISCLLVDAKADTAFNPQANATQARTMEHFRRLGLAQEVRAQGLPADHPTDIAYFTRFNAHELARISLPTAAEAGARLGLKDFDISTWFGLFGPARLPADVTARLNKGFVDALNSPELKARMATLMAEPSPTTPEQFAAFVKAELAKYEPVVKASGAKTD